MAQNQSPVTLGTENVWRLLMQYAIPSVIAMTAASLYNIIDSIFIGHGVGALALSGLAITFPLMNLSAAFGSLVGAGAATLMSLRLGQKDYVTANKILGNVFVLNLLFGLSYTILVLIFLNPILRFFGATPEILPYAHDFMFIISIGNVVTHTYLGLNAMLRAIGMPRKSMYATIGSVIINVILAPVFIFGFEWGIRGAALATVIAQTSMLIWQIFIFISKDSFIRLRKDFFRLKRRIVIDSLSIGLSPFLMNAVSSIIVIIINQCLIKYGGDMAVGAFGVINRIAVLFAMVVFGVTQGMQPIAGYNFGARQYERVTGVMKLTIMVATSVMTFGFLVCELLPGTVASVFTSDKDLTENVVIGLRIAILFFPVVATQMVATNFFQSIGMPGKAIFMSLTRQIIFLLPGLLILPRLLGVKGVWFSMAAADFLSSILAVYMLLVQYKKSVIKQQI